MAAHTNKYYVLWKHDDNIWRYHKATGTSEKDGIVNVKYNSGETSYFDRRHLSANELFNNTEDSFIPPLKTGENQSSSSPVAKENVVSQIGPLVYIDRSSLTSDEIEVANLANAVPATDLDGVNGGRKKRRKTRKTRKTRKNKKRKSKKSKKNIKKKAPTKKRKLRKNKKTKRKKGGSDSDAEMGAEIDEAMKLKFNPNEPVPPVENMWKNYSDEPGLTSTRTGRFKVIPKTRDERMLETLNRNRTTSYNVANFEKNKRANKEKKERELRDQAETSRQIHDIETDMAIDNPNRNQWIGEAAKNQSLVGLQYNFNRASSAARNLSPQEKEDQDRFEPEQGPFGKQSVRKKQKTGS